MKIGYYFLVFSAFSLLSSCGGEGFDLSTEERESVQSEALSDFYMDDTDDMSTLALSADDATLNGRLAAAGRRVFNVIDPGGRMNCAELSIEPAADSSPEHPKGAITLNFGSGCADAKGNVRKGIIQVTYSGRRFLPNFSAETTFDNYYINGVKIEGTHTVASASESTETKPTLSVEFIGGKAIWPDGEVLSRDVHITRKWIRGTTPAADSLIVTGNTLGVNRKGKVYTVKITSPLVFKRECVSESKLFLPVEGKKALTVDGKIALIDYGDGACDNTLKVTINVITKEIDVN